MEYVFIGWCNEGSHDKVWAAIELRQGNGKWSAPEEDQFAYLTVWGRRGKKLQHKIMYQPYQASSDLTWVSTGTVEHKINEKIKKGYKSISTEELKTVYPEFEDDLRLMAMYASFEI
jgi:hypothetical protein